jgi:uncharacterized membrane protein YtjA (UPF0391 family)
MVKIFMTASRLTYLAYFRRQPRIVLLVPTTRSSERSQTSIVLGLNHNEVIGMSILKWALIFFVISIIAGVFGFTGLSAASADVARVLFYIFAVIFLILLILGFTIFRA